MRFRGLGVKGLRFGGFRVSGFKGLRFRGLGFKGLRFGKLAAAKKSLKDRYYLHSPKPLHINKLNTSNGNHCCRQQPRSGIA